jgi:hypothetical protein
VQEYIVQEYIVKSDVQNRFMASYFLLPLSWDFLDR